MRKILLLLMMLICTAISMSAKQQSFEIVFNKGKSDGSTLINSTNYKTNISSGVNFISSVSASTVYVNNTGGIRFGSSGASGNITFSLKDYENYKTSYTVTKIALTCSYWDNDKGSTLNVNSQGDKDVTVSVKTGEETLEWDINSAIASITIASKVQKKRAYVSKITVYYDDGVQETFDPLGAITAEINGKNIEIMEEDGIGIADATVSAGATLTVYCENAKTITLNGNAVQGDTYELPVAFTDGVVEYNFTISNGGSETKEFEIDLRELGIPVLNDGVNDITDKNIIINGAADYFVRAQNAETISYSKDGGASVNIPLNDNIIEISEAGTYVFTATAGEFSTTRTYTVTMANANIPAAPVVTLNGTGLTDGQTVDALLNSTLTITCADATEIWVEAEGEEYDKIIKSNHGEYTLTKSGVYTFQGVNENATEGFGPEVTITFNVKVGTPELRVNGEAVGQTIDFPVGGGDVTVFAADANGNNAIEAVSYTVNGGEAQEEIDNTVSITQSGAYSFIGYAAAMDIETEPITAIITVAEPPAQQIYKRVTNVNDLSAGAKVIIVSEKNGYAAGTSGAPVKAANTGSTSAELSSSHQWIYDESKGVGVFVLTATGDDAYPYAFKLEGNTDNYLQATAANNGTGISSASTDLGKQHKFTISFDNNGAVISSEAADDRKLFIYNTQDLRNYVLTYTSANYVQLYMLEEPAKPLGAVTAEVNKVGLSVNNWKANASVPANNGATASTLTVTCENAKSITVNGNTVQGNKYELPIAFTDGAAKYEFTISNGGNDTKTFEVDLKELGIPTIYKGEDLITGSAIMALAGTDYNVKATNAENISATKDGNPFALGTDNTFSFTEGGSYVFTATAGEFSTTRTYTVTMANVNTPATPVVTFDGTALTNGETKSVLLNSTVTVACDDATKIVVKDPNGEVVPSNNDAYTISKPGAYTFYGINENAPADQQEGVKTTITFELTLGTPEIRMNGEAVATDNKITLPVDGAEITIFAADAKGVNAITAIDYTVGGGEAQSVEGNTVTISEAGTYSFTGYAAEKVASTTITATFEVQQPQIYKRITNVDDLYAGAKVIIVNESDGDAAGKKQYNNGSTLELVKIGAISSGEWIYDETKGVGVFELTSTNNSDYPYAFKLDGTDTYFYAEDANNKTGIEATSAFENKYIFKIGFSGNNAVINPGINVSRQVRFYNNQDVRTYTSSSGKTVQLYMLEEPALPLGEVAATVNGISLSVHDGETDATVPAKKGTAASTLTVTCENAKAITFNENRQRGETYELPIAFEEGKTVTVYTFSITNGEDTKTLTVNLKELGVPMAYVGDVPETGSTIETLAGFENFTLKAKNSASITATKDGEDFAIGDRKTDGSYEFTFNEGDAGNYVFTAHAGDFTTERKYKVERANTEVPTLPVMTFNDNVIAVENGSASVLLNAPIHVEAEHATDMEITGPEGSGVENSTSGDYDFVITKPGTYTFKGINKYSNPTDGEVLTVNFTLTLDTPVITVNGETKEEAFTLSPEGDNIIITAADANGDNQASTVEYTIGDNEAVTKVNGNTVNITKVGTFDYHFTVYSADKVASATFTATITVPAAVIYKRAASVKDIYPGAQVLIVNEASGMALGTDGSPLNAVSTGATDLSTKNRWIYDETKGAGVYVLEKTGENQYAFRLNGTNQYLYNTNSSTGTGIEEATTLATKHKMNVTFVNNGADVQIGADEAGGRILSYYAANSQFRNYTSHSNGHQTQLYVMAEVPQTPTLEVHGQLIADFTEPVKAHIGHEVIFASNGADLMIVNGEEHDGDSYTMEFTEEMFADSDEVVYTVIGKNEVGESAALNVTFKLEPLPATPTIKIGGANVTTADATVKLDDVMTVTSAENTVVVYTRDGGEEIVNDGRTFSYTFTTADYKLNADGTVSSDPTVYTFKARKCFDDGSYVESDVVTLNVVLSEPAVVIPYRKVTSVEEMQPGKKYIIACHGVYGTTNPKTVNHVMGNASQENNRSATPLMKNSREMLEPNGSTMILTLEKDGDYWTISTDNYAAAPGTSYYFRKKTAANGYLLLTPTKADAAKYTVSFDNKGNVILTTLKTDDQASYTIVCNASGTTYSFGQYTTDKYNTASNYAAVQLYVRESSDDPCAYNYAEFQDLCKKHPGREVKFVDRVTILAHHDNMIWMKDQEGDHLFATYDAGVFAGYHMNELCGNRHFWNFSGKLTTYQGKENGPVHMEITSIDHEYEHEINGTTAKVPHLRQLDGHLDVPRFDESKELGWWQFGQLKGTLRVVNGEATIETTYGTYTILTTLAGTAPEGISRRRYADGDVAPNWKPGDNTFFTGTHEHANTYVSGSVMPDEDGDKALMAMAVSDDVITGVSTIGTDDPEAIVDVYNMQGIRLRHNVRRADALRNLPAGIYIVNGKKVLLNR